MKTVIKINPEQEYECAKKIIEEASINRLSQSSVSSLSSSVDNLITVARVLMEREENRRGKQKPPKENPKPKGRKKGEDRGDITKLPSKRYPNLEINETIVRPVTPPKCLCCGEVMKESGLFDVSEKLEAIPKKYYIERQKRVKYNCGKCYGGMINTPAKPSIVPLSNYGDSLIIDASLSKYCDLIPMERYTAIAAREGLEGLPPQSLIENSHHLADFLSPAFVKIKTEVLSSKHLNADETTHKMLEGDDTKNWYLWGFFCSHACYYEAHNTRSGDVIKDFLKNSRAESLMSDDYAGYSRAIREINKEYNRNILGVLCNAHAFRYFRDASSTWKEECKLILEFYGEIYDLESKKKLTTSADEQLKLRKKMIQFFERIEDNCKKLSGIGVKGGALEKAVNYFLSNYKELTVCTQNIAIPLDNNFSEQNLRPPVVGRKTWYGNHSKRGAFTNAVLFSIVQSCKVNGINPRAYFSWIVKRIHNKEEILSFYEYSKLEEGTQ
ncbi:MAG: IS66 family transposase [Oligoflexia bacterium]|nr:IS66 family transposase [Oligoflexia bacterium]